MRLLLDEMYPAVLAERLRDRGHDVVSVHEVGFAWLEGAPDADVLAAALDDHRAVVTENVPDFRRLQHAALASGEPYPVVVFTTNRQFPRGDRATIGRLVVALDALLHSGADATTVFLQPPDPA